MTKKTIFIILKKNSRQIRACGVEKIGIFGSFVYLTQHKNSDIDILVEFEKGKKSFDNFMSLKFLLEKLFRRKVDLVTKEALKQEIKKMILKEVSYARL